MDIQVARDGGAVKETEFDVSTIPEKFKPETGLGVTVTPAMAKYWLENLNYDDNRPISKTTVAFYKRQILGGRWVLNGQPIIFDTHLHLLNGQHRLTAVAEAGRSIKIDIRVGIDAGTFTTMDQGLGRTGAQVMKMRGMTNATTRASICRLLWFWEMGNGKLAPSGKVSPDELLLVQECYPDEVEAATSWAGATRAEVPIPSGYLGLAHILFSRARPKKAPEFFEVLGEGVTSIKNHPALTLRKRIIKDKMNDKEMPNAAMWAAMIRAWNAFDKGELLTSILVSRGKDGDWVTQNIRGLGKDKTGGRL